MLNESNSENTDVPLNIVVRGVNDSEIDQKNVLVVAELLGFVKMLKRKYEDEKK